MKIIFDQAGKYKNGIKTLIVHQEDVNKNKVYDVVEKNAANYINAKKARPEGVKKETKKDKEDKETKKDKEKKEI